MNVNQGFQNRHSVLPGGRQNTSTTPNSSSSMALRFVRWIIRGDQALHLQRLATARAIFIHRKQFPFLPLTTWTASTTLCAISREGQQVQNSLELLHSSIMPRQPAPLPAIRVRALEALAEMVALRNGRNSASRSEARYSAQKQKDRRKMDTRLMIAPSRRPEKTRSGSLTPLDKPSRNPKRQTSMIKFCLRRSSKTPRRHPVFSEKMATFHLRWQGSLEMLKHLRWTSTRLSDCDSCSPVKEQGTDACQVTSQWNDIEP